MNDSERLDHANEMLACLKLIVEQKVIDLHHQIDEGDILKISTFSEKIQVIIDKIVRQLHFKQYLESQMGKSDVGED